MTETCNVQMWPADEYGDATCGETKPCHSHNYKEWYLAKFPEGNYLKITPCPYCGGDGPGGVWLLNGELSYGNGRWECKDCFKGIEGKLFKDR